MEVLQRPGGELATRPIHFFWVVDCSGSMYGEKIGIVNNTIQECIPEMRTAADNNPNAQLLIRPYSFLQVQVGLQQPQYLLKIMAGKIWMQMD